MKTWKLVSGIISMILFALVALQSCAVGIGNAMMENGQHGGMAGILVAFLMLSGGIVSVSTRRNRESSGNMALIVLFGLATFFGFVFSDGFPDLKIWAGWCLANMIVVMVSVEKDSKRKGVPCDGGLSIAYSILGIAFIKLFLLGLVFSFYSMLLGSSGKAENENDVKSSIGWAMSMFVMEAVLLYRVHF